MGREDPARTLERAGPTDLLELIAVGGVIDNDIKIECAPGETTPEFPDHLLPKGFKGIQDEAQALLDAVDLTVPANYEKRDFWQAAVIVNEGLRILCRRHAEAAEALAARESDPIRKAEPSTSLPTAPSSRTTLPPPSGRHSSRSISWFMACTWKATRRLFAGPHGSVSLPYYLRDRAEGILDDATALELIGVFLDRATTPYGTGTKRASSTMRYCSFQNVCLGGLSTAKQGRTASTSSRTLMLKATIDLQMVQPSVSVRLSKKNPEDYFLKIAELVRTGSGFPAIYNEEVGLKMLMKKGVPLEKAWDWSCIGCVEPSCPARPPNGVRRDTIISPPPWSSPSQTASIARAASGSASKPAIPKPPPPTRCSKAAVYAQLDRLIRQFSISQNLIERLQQQFFPNPLISMSILDCVENGKDLMHGGARYNVGPGMNGNGVADFADSLIAVKKLVYDEKRLPMHNSARSAGGGFSGL